MSHDAARNNLVLTMTENMVAFRICLKKSIRDRLDLSLNLSNSLNNSALYAKALKKYVGILPS